MTIRIVTLCLPIALLALPACAPDAPRQDKPPAQTREEKQGKPYSFASNSDLLEFSYSFPAEAEAIPGLAKALREDQDAALASARADAEDAKADAVTNDYPFRTYMWSKQWGVLADTPRLLSLIANLNMYMGGAHGNQGYDTLIWDKANDRPVALVWLFADFAAGMAAIRDDYCSALNRERAARGAEMSDDPDDPFNACPSFDEVTIALGSRDGKAIDTLHVYAAPYVAGSYAEGSYEIDLPVNAALVEQVKPEFRDAFAVK